MNIRTLYYILTLTTALTLTGCLEKLQNSELANGSKEVVVRIEMPEELGHLDRDGFKVTLRNAQSGTSYVMATDSRGESRIDAEYGVYNLTVSKSALTNETSMLLHASIDFVLKRNDALSEVRSLRIKATPRGAIIIKEFYFHTTKTPAGSANYIFDQYLSLYNNSDQVQYLDGLGVGFHPDFNSGAVANFTKYWMPGSTELRDSIPINAFGFIFPGTGAEYALNPGEEVVVALSAIEHTAEKTSLPMDLAYENVWAMYIDHFGSGSNQKPPMVGVQRMECFCELAPGVAVVISRISPAAVLYRLPENPYDYVREGPVSGRPYGNVIFQPPKYTFRPSIMIPSECVLDGVEFKNVATHVPRLCPEVSLHPMPISSANSSGVSYIRKEDVEASQIVGRTVYCDTNNSAQDWMQISEPTLATSYKNRQSKKR